jgi:outer membrane protein assembly factor BamB
VSVWTHFRGDSHNTGRAPSRGATGTVAWTFQTGAPIFGTSAIAADGTIYETSLDGHLYGLHPDGTLALKFQAGAGIEEAGPGLAPNGTIVFGADDHKVYDIDRSGGVFWTFQTSGIIFSSPSFESDGTVIIGSYFANPGVATSGAFDGKVYAIDLYTGKVKWSYQTQSAVGSSAAIGPDNTVYIGSNDGFMYALDGSNGHLKWKFATGGIIESCPALSENGILYFGSKDNKVYAVNAATGAQVWSYTTGDKVVSSPAITPDGTTIYVGSWDHKLYSFNAATGAVNWTFLTGDLGDPSPIIGTDGTIYYSSNDGHVYAVNPNGTQKWAAAVDPIIYTSVSMAKDGTLYEGTMTGKLFAIK